MRMESRRKKLIAVISSAVFAIAALALTLYEMFANSDENMPAEAVFGLETAERLLLFGAFGCLIFAFGYARLLLPRFRGGIVATLAALAVALSNFPFFTLGSGQLVYTASIGRSVLYILFCVSIGLFEETAFRSLLMPIFIGAMKNRKSAPVLAVLFSSGLFALAHLFNLFGGAIGATFLQVGYTFLTGCMFGALLILTRSVAAPVIAHTLYNIGGLLGSADMASGSQWNAPAIAVMAVVSVLAGAYLVFAVLRRTAFGNTQYLLVERKTEPQNGEENSAR